MGTVIVQYTETIQQIHKNIQTIINLRTKQTTCKNTRNNFIQHTCEKMKMAQDELIYNGIKNLIELGHCLNDVIIIYYQSSKPSSSSGLGDGISTGASCAPCFHFFDFFLPFVFGVGCGDAEVDLGGVDE